MNIDAEIERLTLAVLRAQLRTSRHNEAKAAAERRIAELTEQRVIDEFARVSALRRGGGK